MSQDEFEVSYRDFKVVARGLLAIKLVFVGGFTGWYLLNVLPNFRVQVVLATTIYLLGVIAFVAVFFGSWRLTFRRNRRIPKKQKKAAKGKTLEEWMREQK